ncbi:MAG: hypothetical protein L3K19_00435 [Thermoplasmata archaeon]|nr:hypothetical protein [Thermoplasmata archaeon]
MNVTVGAASLNVPPIERAAASAVFWVAGVALAATDPNAPWLRALLVGAILGGAVALSFWPRRELRLLSLALAVVGLATGALAAQVNPLSGILAGLAGLALLYWATSSGEGRERGTGALAGLTLPGLATGVAVATGLLLPSTQEQVGAAAALAVGVFVYLAFILARAEPGSESDAPSL